MTQQTEERQEIVSFRAQDRAIAKLADDYMGLRIDGLDDTAGFKKVHAARMVVKNYRVDVEKKRKELKDEALRYGRTVDTEARRLTELLEPIESHLEAEEDAVVQEKERIKKAAEDAKRAIVEARLKALVDLGATPNPLLVSQYTEETFQAAIKVATEAKADREQREQAERERIAAADKAREELAATLRAERIALEKIKAEQEAEATRLRNEQARLDAEHAAQLRAVELENAKREAAERARVETEQRIAAEQARAKQEAIDRAAREKEAADAKEAARIQAEAERPYRDKLRAVATLVEDVEVPAGPRYDEVVAILFEAAGKIRAIADSKRSLTPDMEF